VNRTYRHRHRHHQRGYLLLPVVITLALLASISYLLSHDSALHLAGSRGEADRLEARYVAEAGLNHAYWQAQQANCTAYPSLGNQPFGNHSYSTVINPTGGSPISITASALLANGSRYSISRDTVETYESPITHTLVLGTDPGGDALLVQSNPSQNFGDYELQVSGLLAFQRHSLLTFDLSALPSGIRLIGAELQLYQLNTLSLGGNLTAHRVTSSWVEGTSQGTGSPDGSTWNTHDGSNGWSSPGGDHQTTPIASASARLTSGWISWNIGAQVERWLDGTEANHGLLLKTGLVSTLSFASKEHNDDSLRPRLVLTYACPCDAGATGTSLMLQPDAASGADTYIDDANPGTNWGAETRMRITNKSNSQKRGLLRFELAAIPPEALITSATLTLHLEGIGSGNVADIYLHRVTRDWSPSLANWNSATAVTSWTSPGGDIDPTVIASAVIDPLVLGATQWNITTLVGDWVAGNQDNHGLMLLGSAGVNHADFSSSQHATPALRPTLTVQYHCPCGVQCSVPLEPSCRADFVPTTISQQFSSTGLDDHYSGGITAVPGGMSFNGTSQVPAEGGWLTVGDKGSLVLLDHAGTRLDNVNIGGDKELSGVTYIPQGAEAGKLVVVRESSAILIDPSVSIPHEGHTDFTLAEDSKLGGASYISGGAYDGQLAFVDSNASRLLITDQAFNLLHSVTLTVPVGESGVLNTNYQAIAHLPESDLFLVLDADSSRGFIFDSQGNLHSESSLAAFGIQTPTAAAINPDNCEHQIGSLADNHYWSLQGTAGTRGRILVPAADNFIDSGEAQKNYGNENDLRLGKTNQSELRRPLLSFDLGSLPAGAQLNSARLRLYANQADMKQKDWSLFVHRITESWTEPGSDWRTRDGDLNWSLGDGGSYDPTAVASQSVVDENIEGSGWWYEFSIATLVQEWIDGVSPNHGLQLLTNAPKANGLTFDSRENNDAPQLVIIYSQP
jgi:type II secretory pathway pseudopilin PulG